MSYRTRLLFLIISLVTTVGWNARGCPGASIELNDDTYLQGDGVYSWSGSKLVKGINPVTDLKMVGSPLRARNKAKEETHVVIILGYKADAEGIISTSYLVKDLKTGEEKVLLLNTNYLGNGVRARGIDEPTSNLTESSDFKSLRSGGC
jgi:hypothetical protein